MSRTASRGFHFDRRVTFRARTEVVGSMGGVSETYTDLAETPLMWAMKWAEEGRELYQARQINASITGGFIIRYRADFAALDQTKMQLVEGGRTYSIDSITEADMVDGRAVGRRRYMRVLVSAGV
jgi:SPP1 family predicted phage head-tail adaptor